MKTRQQNELLWDRIERGCNNAHLTMSDINTLRRAQMALHRWAERLCGDSNDYASFALVREDDGSVWQETHPHNGSRTLRYRAPDLERGALFRVARICAAYGLHYYHQTDPRGCALYVSGEPLTDQNYSHGVACSI